MAPISVIKYLFNKQDVEIILRLSSAVLFAAVQFKEYRRNVAQRLEDGKPGLLNFLFDATHSGFPVLRYFINPFSMNIHWIQHVPFEGLGCIGPWLVASHHAVSYTRLWADETFPNIGTVDGLIIMGGPMGVTDEDQYPWFAVEKAFIKTIIDQNKLVLGSCLGAQLIADALGSRVWKSQRADV